MIVRTKKEFEDELSTGIWKVIFIKCDDSIRELVCTRDFDYVSNNSENWITPKGVRRVSPRIVVVWDIEKNAFRSFRINSVISVNRISEDTSDALLKKNSVDPDKVRDRLSHGVYKIKYHRIDGKLISTYGTRDFKVIPKFEDREGNKISSKRIPPINQIIYWDMKSSGWRSFRSELLISMTKVDISMVNINENIGIPQSVLNKILETCICRVEFIKRNGELRNMICTKIPKLMRNYDGIQYPHLLSVYDLDKNDYRNIRYDSILKFEEIKNG